MNMTKMNMKNVSKNETTHSLLMALLLTSAGLMGSAGMTAVAQTGNSKYIQAVDDYVPAPGQFVNMLPKFVEGDTQQSINDKCTAAIANGKNSMITLGSYGGYVTFHFDHPVINVKGEMDLYIRGNGYNGNSEPGIVMVSVDENANGMPDDTWYELQGSADEDSAALMTYNYSITYTRAAADSALSYTDSKGEQGTIEKNAFHKQDYYPLWIADNQLTFTGTRLPKNGVNQGTDTQPYWVLNGFRYGYVDNAANTDSTACSFNLDWAVDADRQPVSLTKVDFVKIYCAENQYCGWLGETSTEVSGAEDLHPDAILAGISHVLATGDSSSSSQSSVSGSHHQSISSVAYNLNGQQVTANGNRKQLLIINGKKVIR